MGLAIGILSGFGQTAMVGTAFALPLVVVVADDVTFLPVPGETVTFTVTLGSASVLPLTAVTNALGEASTTITAGLTIGPVAVHAAVTGASVDCALTVTPTITQAPVLIDSTYFSMNYQGFGIPLFFSPTLTLGTPSSAFPGPYEYGGKLYYVGYASLEMPHPQPDAPITAYSNIGYGPFIALVSSDGGATWALRDIANRPTFYISYSAPNPLVDVTTPPLPVLWRFIGGKVYWSMLAFGQFIAPYTSGQAWNAFGSFDLTSELFSPAILTDTGWKSYGQGALAPAQVSLWPYTATDQIGGDLDTHESTIPPPPFVLNPDYGKGRLLTQIPGVGETDITPAYFAAWAHTKFEVAVSAVDSANKLHIIFRTITIPAATQYFYMRLDYGQPIEITAILPTDFPSGVDCNFGNPCFMGADWIVPVRDGDGHFGVVRVVNYSQNAPTITYEPITPDPLNPAVTNTSSCAAGGDIFVFFVAGVDLTLPQFIYFSVNDGTGWSTPELVCDNSILPTLPGDVGIKHFGTLSAALLANGDFGFITSTDFNVPAYSGSASIYFAARITGLAVLVVTKIVSPGTDSGLFNLQIDGVTQAINQGNGGTTGPVTVSAGTHQVGETAGIGTNLSDYTTAYGGDAAPDGSIVLTPAAVGLVHVNAADVIRAAEQEVENSHVSSRCGPWAYGGKLYIIGQTGYGTLSGQLVVYRSTDGGATWAEIDAGNGPLTQYSDAAGNHFRTFNVARDGVDRSGTVLYIGYASPDVPGNALVAFCPFDLAMETWGMPKISTFSTEPTAGSGNEPSFRVEYRAVTNDLVITTWEADGMGLDTHRIYTVTPAGVWAYIGNLSQVNWLYDTVSCVSHLGADEWVHFLWIDYDGGTQIGSVTHQSLDKNNVLSIPQAIFALHYAHCPAGWMGTTTPGLPAQNLGTNETYGEPYGDGSGVVFPMMARNFWNGVGGKPTAITDLACIGLVFHGTSAANPTWTVGEFYRGTGRPGFAGAIFNAYWFNGASAFRSGLNGKLYIIRNTRSETGLDVHDQLIQVENTIGSTWGNDTVLFTQTDADYLNGLKVLNNIFVAADATNSVGWNLRCSYGVTGFLQNNDDVLTLWTLCGALIKTVIITNTRKPAAVVARPRVFGTRRIVILEPNSFDDCLKGLPELYRHIPWDQGICCVPDRYDYGQWKKFRPDAEPFRSIKAIPTPLAAAGEVLVTTFWPPLGWDGVLHGIFNRYTGPGFREGGGDIEWRLQFGPAYPKQMGNILVQFGQVNQFYKLSQGIPFRSHRPIRFWVYAPNTSGGILPVNSQIVCGLEGWIVPRK